MMRIRNEELETELVRYKFLCVHWVFASLSYLLIVWAIDMPRPCTRMKTRCPRIVCQNYHRNRQGNNSATSSPAQLPHSLCQNNFNGIALIPSISTVSHHFFWPVLHCFTSCRPGHMLTTTPCFSLFIISRITNQDHYAFRLQNTITIV